jgi:hypothetical protein
VGPFSFNLGLRASLFSINLVPKRRMFQQVIVLAGSSSLFTFRELRFGPSDLCSRAATIRQRHWNKSCVIFADTKERQQPTMFWPGSKRTASPPPTSPPVNLQFEASLRAGGRTGGAASPTFDPGPYTRRLGWSNWSARCTDVGTAKKNRMIPPPPCRLVKANAIFAQDWYIKKKKFWQ